MPTSFVHAVEFVSIQCLSSIVLEGGNVKMSKNWSLSLGTLILVERIIIIATYSYVPGTRPYPSIMFSHLIPARDL